MNTIKEIGISICVTAIATAIFHCLVPKSALDKTIRFVLSIFFISCLIVPILEIDFFFLEDVESAFQNSGSSLNQTSFEESVNTRLLELTKKTVTSTIKGIFSQNDITAEEIEVFVSMGEPNDIIVEQIDIVVRKSDKDKAEVLIETLSQLPDESIINLKTTG